MTLSDANLKQALPGAVLFDDRTPGLHARVFKERTSFYLYFRPRTGGQRKPKIGLYPVMTIVQARDVAKAMLLEVAMGRDPTVDRKAAETAPTVAQLCAKYLKDYAPKKKSSHQDKIIIDRFVLPKMGRLQVAAVTHDDIANLHTDLAATPFMANRVLALLSRAFTLAERWGYRPHHTRPTRFVDRFPEPKRRRIMATGEAAAIAARLKHYAATRPDAVAFIYVLILSGARCGEVAAAQWEWLDGSTLRLPDSKTGAKPVYLPPQVMELLEPRRKAKGPLIGIASPRALWDVVRAEAGCPDLRLHDLRRTFASAALTAGYTLDQVGELLGHASTQTTAGYAYMMPQPAALAVEAIASKLEEMMEIAS